MKYNKKPIANILRSGNTVFTFKDISLIWGDTDKSASIAGVNYYVKTGGLYRIRRGIYAKNQNYDKWELAIKIYTPSYISFETVLAKEGIVFQNYNRIFIASYLTREIICDGQVYSFRKVKDTVLTDSLGIENKDNHAIAVKERAFLDTIYLNKDYHFDNLSSMDWDKCFEILPAYQNKAMTKKLDYYYKSSKD